MLGGGIGNGYSPVSVVGLNNVSKVATGNDFSCAISGGGLHCWGENSSGQLGNNSTENSSLPVQVEGLTSNVTAVDAREWRRLCAIHEGAAKCWGNYEITSLGKESGSKVPLPVEGLSSDVTEITLSNRHACAIQRGAAKCWGSNEFGQLGNNSTLNSDFPVMVEGLSSGVTSIAAGENYTCAVVSGRVRCWGGASTLGIPNRGVLGLNDLGMFNTKVPNDVPLLPPGATSVASSANHVCAIVEGNVYCWGSNVFQEVGNRPDLARFVTSVHLPVLRPIIE